VHWYIAGGGISSRAAAARLDSGAGAGAGRAARRLGPRRLGWADHLAASSLLPAGQASSCQVTLPLRVGATMQRAPSAFAAGACARAASAAEPTTKRQNR
jgi:hypothetical protein